MALFEVGAEAGVVVLENLFRRAGVVINADFVNQAVEIAGGFANVNIAG